MTDPRRIDKRAMAGLRRSSWPVLALFSLLWALGSEWGGRSALQMSAAAAEVQEPLVPLPLTLAIDPARVALGARLFQDARLSGQNTMACTARVRSPTWGALASPGSRGTAGCSACQACAMWC